MKEKFEVGQYWWLDGLDKTQRLVKITGYGPRVVEVHDHNKWQYYVARKRLIKEWKPNWFWKWMGY